MSKESAMNILKSAIVSKTLAATALVVAGLFTTSAFAQQSAVSNDASPAIWRLIKLSKDPSMFESLLEDSAALIGIGLAAIGVLGSVFFNVLWLDAAASVAIGLLLIATSYIIATATRSLIAGEGPAPALQKEIEDVLREAGFAGTWSDLRSLHLGPNTILVTLVLDLPNDATQSSVKSELQAITRRVKHVDDRIRHVFFEVRGNEG
jgi:divalent metal cation (Fe/Co/Zn/Cd) transporter